MSCKVSDFGLSRELSDDTPDSEYETQVCIICVVTQLHDSVLRTESDLRLHCWYVTGNEGLVYYPDLWQRFKNIEYLKNFICA